MSSPDFAAASFDASTPIPWKGEAPPRPGSEIRLTTMITEGNRRRSVTTSGRVRRAESNGPILTIELWERGKADSVRYELDATSLISRWSYFDAVAAHEGDAPIAAVPLLGDDVPTPAVEVSAPEDVEDAESPATLPGIIREFILVERRLDVAEAEVKSLKARKAQLSTQAVDTMIADGIDSPPGVDGMTAFLSPVYHVERKVDETTGETATSDQVADALRAAGYGAYITEGYNGNQLKALLRELVESGRPIPEALDGVVVLKRRSELRVRPAGAAKRKAAPQRPVV